LHRSDDGRGELQNDRRGAHSRLVSPPGTARTRCSLPPMRTAL
jgi:hypothetical protein